MLLAALGGDIIFLLNEAVRLRVIRWLLPKDGEYDLNPGLSDERTCSFLLYHTMYIFKLVIKTLNVGLLFSFFMYPLD